MAALEFVWDSRDLEAWRDQRVEKALVRAVSKAGGDAIRFMRTGSGRLVRQRKRFKANAVREGLPIFFPTRKQQLQSLIWKMEVSGKPMPLVDFPHRQGAKGVSIAVNAGKRTLVRSAFIATMKSGHKGVFLRELSGFHGPLTKKQARRDHKFRVRRLPIQEAFTTRLTDVFHDQGFVPFVIEGAQMRFAAAFDRLLPLELAKAK